MRQRTAAIATAAFAAAAPGTVAGVLPWRLRGQPSSSLPGGPVSRIVSGVLVLGGTAVVAEAFVRFVRARGTPAPVAETEELVVDGLYRLTRNPQYVGVLSVIVGQGLGWRSWRTLAYGGAVATGFHLWVKAYEEPRLRLRFGDAYTRYAETVPRWPRPRPRCQSVPPRSSCGAPPS